MKENNWKWKKEAFTHILPNGKKLSKSALSSNPTRYYCNLYPNLVKKSAGKIYLKGDVKVNLEEVPLDEVITKSEELLEKLEKRMTDKKIEGMTDLQLLTYIKEKFPEFSDRYFVLRNL